MCFLFAILMKKYYILYTRIYFFFPFSFTYYMIESCNLYTMDQLCRSFKNIFREATRRECALHYVHVGAPYIFVYLHKKETKPHIHIRIHTYTRAPFYARISISFFLSLSFSRSSIDDSRAHLLCLQFVLRMYRYAS